MVEIPFWCNLLFGYITNLIALSSRTGWPTYREYMRFIVCQLLNVLDFCTRQRVEYSLGAAVMCCIPGWGEYMHLSQGLSPCITDFSQALFLGGQSSLRLWEVRPPNVRMLPVANVYHVFPFDTCASPIGRVLPQHDLRDSVSFCAFLTFYMVDELSFSDCSTTLVSLWFLPANPGM